ncbi:3-hydroxyacyl-CoA dehydrogenase NAD-binding domain-containing protein [Psychromonas sp. SP041]|uniref:3-hydroxyacyl-CoA dehydrogenase NAD-binding domain-containing protein n=1 Tax=Psychromonas sp. SP041 TaxID=1365007 RepID=UPI00041956AA|nr:3-hydroxyacyl-CoA dehydrogenase NAD-binding domain-containing protein [Psychromonas sp. SP041]
MKHIQIQKNDWLIRVTFDYQDQAINKLSAELMKELFDVIKDIETAPQKVVSFESAKKDIFIAGAAIEELQKIDSVEMAKEKAQQGLKIFKALELLPQTTVAIIDGACVGGGCELALACNFRLATDNPKTKIGLPEVKLGILPGWGGTQRLPRLVGLPEALAMILPGKLLPAAKAYRIKLVDKVISSIQLEQQIDQFLEDLRETRFQESLLSRREPKSLAQTTMAAAMDSHLARLYILKKAHQNVMKTTKGLYPAPLAVLEVYRKKCNFEEGIQRELSAFSNLAPTDVCKNLISLFFLNEQVKKEQRERYPQPETLPTSGAVLGAGVMGGGIAWLMSSKGLSVRIKDINWESIQLGYQQAADYFNQLKKRRRIKQAGIDTAINRIGASLDYTGFNHAQIAIEAVVEVMQVKKQVLKEAEAVLPESSLLCTNTSALSVTEMATVLTRPSQFCGMHFFNPVNRMPLVEIVRGEQTSEETIAKAVAISKAWGKVPIVVNDCPGFLVNRILLPYLNEAAYLLQEGADIEKVDSAITTFGMPMGPFQLADEIGIDVGYKVAAILEAGFGERMAVAPILEHIHGSLKLSGKKGGRGFYHYKNKEVEVNQLLYQADCVASSKDFSDQDIIDRLMLVMVNEAAHCIDEGIVENPGQLDLAMIMGTGFPAWRGGLCRWADSIGCKEVVQRLDKLQQQVGIRYQVSPYLQKCADEQRGFY